MSIGLSDYNLEYRTGGDILYKTGDDDPITYFGSTTRVTFLGASIINFQSNLGWGTQSSTLTVNLVEDSTNQDSFAPPSVGQPVYFDYHSVSFGGLLQSWKQSDSESGHPLYEVTVVDPREILDGVQLILGGYTGDVSDIPNLYNVYKYWEDTGFGNAEVNETGIPHGKINTGLSALISGKKISFRGYDYTISFSNLPSTVLPSVYRVGGENISFLEYLDDICNASGHDYHVTLTAGAVIRIYTINRTLIPVFGAVQAFVDAQTGAVSKSVGRELRNETNAKFLSGGNKEEFYFKTYDNGLGGGYPYTNDIWPYWGTDINGNLVIGSGTNNTHRLDINTSALRDDTVGSSYSTDTDELRHALVSEQSWQQFLVANSGDSDSIHYQKAGNLGLSSTMGDWNRAVEGLTGEGIGGVKLAEFAPMPKDIIEAMKRDEEKFRRTHQFYEWLSNYSSIYYGKKFMVRMPFASADWESDTGRVMLTHSPVSTAYLEESQWSGATANHILPSGLHKFTDQNDKIYGYVRFTDTGADGIYDVSELDESDYTRFDGYLFVKVQVDENAIFVNRSALSDPRAVITLPGRVKPKNTSSSKDALGNFANALDGTTPAPTESKKDKIMARPGADAFFITREGLSYVPSMVALPIRSNVDTYGPWYALGADGKVEYEKNDTLVPWNYGGYTQMNLVGQALVNTNISLEQANEGGVIVVPDVPSRNLGDQLVVQSGYPYVTDINVSCGPGGVTTTYILQQWTPRFGMRSKQQIERFKKHTLRLQKGKKYQRELFTSEGRLTGNIKSSKTMPEREASTSHPIIMGEIVPVPTSSGTFTNMSFSEVVIAPYTNVGMTLGENYTRMGMGSLDSLFRPFDITDDGHIDIETSGVLMPHFETPSGDSPTIDDLNPFTEPHDMSMFIQGSSVPTGGLAIDSSGTAANADYRPMGLRTPMVLVGWGYDTGGNPVPASTGDPTVFLEDHRRRQDQWKVGPLDVRWEDDRKVWVGGSTIKVAQLSNTLHPGSDASGILVTGTDYSTSGNTIDISDPLYTSFGMIGEKITVYNTNDRYEPIGENGLFRKCILGELLVSGGCASGVVDDLDTDVHVSICDDILATGQTVQGGLRGYMEYHRIEHKWYLTQVSCSGEQ